MSTRSRIGILNEDRTVTSIYCHFDGYPSGVGAILVAHYHDTVKVRRLLELGDISSLGTTTEGQPFDEQPRLEDRTVAYGRDRGETGTEADKSVNLAQYVIDTYDSGGEYAYVLNGEHWLVCDLDKPGFFGRVDWLLNGEPDPARHYSCLSAKKVSQLTS